MTLVLLKRTDRVRASRAFGRRIASIEAIFAFTADFFVRTHVDEPLRSPVDMVVEELFTNMVKYGAAADPGTEVRIDMERIEGGVQVTLTDSGVEPFDVTQAPDADVDLPLDQRKPGGLGLHLIRRMVDSWHYEYRTETRESRITFRKTMAGWPARDNATTTGGT